MKPHIANIKVEGALANPRENEAHLFLPAPPLQKKENANSTFDSLARENSLLSSDG